MLTKILRYIIRTAEVGLAVAVAGSLFGPQVTSATSRLLRAPVAKETSQADPRRTSAIQPALPIALDTPAVLTPSPLALHSATPSPVAVTHPTPFVTAPAPEVTHTITPEPTHSVAPAEPTTAPSATHTAVPVTVPTATATPTTKPSSTPTPTKTVIASTTHALKVAAVLTFARAQKGEPYVFGGMGLTGWDCSGLTKAAFAAVGINIGTHSATNQYNTASARGDLHPYSAVQKGDLIFYTGGGTSIEHVTIYAGNGMMVEAARPGTNVREVPVRSQFRLSQVARFIP